MANSYSGRSPSSGRRSSNAPDGTVKLLGVLALVGVGAVIAFGRKPGDVVTGKSGSLWRVVLVSNSGGVKQYDIRDAGTSELILRYSQTGSDMASRKLVAVGQGTDAARVRTAASDFSVPLPGGN